MHKNNKGNKVNKLQRERNYYGEDKETRVEQGLDRLLVRKMKQKPRRTSVCLIILGYNKPSPM